jgi:hypothetical protein
MMEAICNLVTMSMVGISEAFLVLGEPPAPKTYTVSRVAILYTPARQVLGTFTTSFPSIT